MCCAYESMYLNAIIESWIMQWHSISIYIGPIYTVLWNNRQVHFQFSDTSYNPDQIIESLPGRTPWKCGIMAGWGGWSQPRQVFCSRSVGWICPLLLRLWNSIPARAVWSVPIAEFRGRLCGRFLGSPLAQADGSSPIQLFSEAVTSGPEKRIFQQGSGTQVPENRWWTCTWTSSEW